MKKATIILIGAIYSMISASTANPISVNGDSVIKKSWERCLVAVGNESAIVSCAIGYKSVKRATRKLYIMMPVYWPRSKQYDIVAIRKAVSARLECDGRIYMPSYAKLSSSQDVLPLRDGEVRSGHVAIDFMFEIDYPKGSDFSIVTSYKQPIIKGLIYYMPLFEEGESTSPDNAKKFSITFFPLDSSKLSLMSSHADRVKQMATRITVAPKHREMITVSRKK